MKTFKKVLASTLAAAMVVTALPVTPANAAATPKLSTTKAAVYVGQSKTIKVTTPKTWKSVKVKATTSKKSVATVKASKKKVTVKAVKAGTAKVTVKVTGKKGKKAVKKTLKATITVKNPTLSVSAANVVAIGATETVKTTVKPSKAKVSYKSSDATIATVDAKGVVTGVKTGDVTITVSAKSGKKTVSKDVKMTVKKAILKDVKQTEVNKVVATVVGDTKDLKAADFKITNTATNATVAVKSATADKNDATKVTIETFTDMKDAKEYTVVYDNVTAKFTATDATPAKVGIDTVQIPAASKTKVQATLLDANQVVLSRTPLDQTDTSKGKVTSAVTLTKGYQDGTQIYLPAVGDTATIKVTYHTGTFGTDGKEAGNLEDTFTVTAVDPSAVNLSYAMTISKNAPAWTAASFQANNKVAMGEERNAYIRITKDDGTEISDSEYAAYKVESADKTKLLVTEKPLKDSKDAVVVRGVAEGTTYILITKDGKAVYSLPVTVVGKPVATTLDLGKTSATVMAGKDVEEVASVTLKSQYGDSMSGYTLASEILSKPEESEKKVGNPIGNTDDASKYVVKGTNFDKTGTYQIKLTAKKDNKELSRTFTVTVVKTEETAQSYELKVSAPEVDTTVGKDDTVVADSKAIALSVVRKANGAAIDEMSDTVAYTIKNAKGEVVYDKDHAKDFVNATPGKLTVKPYTVDDKKIKKNLPAGTYSVQAKFTVASKDVVVNGTFTIKDTQDTRVSFNILDNKFGNNTVADAFALTGDAKKVKVFYDGVEQKNAELGATNVKGVALTNGGAYIKTVDVYVNVSGGDNYVLVTLNVNDQLASVKPEGITE